MRECTRRDFLRIAGVGAAGAALAGAGQVPRLHDPRGARHQAVAHLLRHPQLRARR